jgi:hypothetical protein
VKPLLTGKWLLLLLPAQLSWYPAANLLMLLPGGARNPVVLLLLLVMLMPLE